MCFGMRSLMKNYILKGYAVNHNRISQLGEVIKIMKRAEERLDAKQVLTVIERYSLALEELLPARWPARKSMWTFRISGGYNDNI